MATLCRLVSRQEGRLCCRVRGLCRVVRPLLVVRLWAADERSLLSSLAVGPEGASSLSLRLKRRFLGVFVLLVGLPSRIKKVLCCQHRTPFHHGSVALYTAVNRVETSQAWGWWNRQRARKRWGGSSLRVVTWFEDPFRNRLHKLQGSRRRAPS